MRTRFAVWNNPCTRAKRVSRRNEFEGQTMGLWRDFRLTGELKVAVHALLLFSPELAKTIVAHKGQWIKSARASVNRGERVGDVAAFVVIDYITKPMAIDPAVRVQLADNLSTTREYDSLLVANQAIIGMIANAKLMKEPDYSPTLGYVIASRYSQALFDLRNHDLIVQDLMERAESHRSWMVSEFKAASAEASSQPPPVHSLTEQHLGIIQNKLNHFVRSDYKPLTDRYFQSYAAAVEAIDNRDPDARRIVQQHTDAFRAEIQRLNSWAWDAARNLIDRDVVQLETSLGSKNDPKIAERCADIVEHTIEGQSNELIAAVAACRNAKLDEIDRGSTQTSS